MAQFSVECRVGFYEEPLYLGWGCGILVRKLPSGFLPAQQGQEWCLYLGWCVRWPVGLSRGLQTGALVHGLLGTGVIAGGEWWAE